MFDEIKSRADAASAQLAGLQRESETSDPDRRAAIEGELAQAREADAAARRELADAGIKREALTPAGAGTEAGFSSAESGADVVAEAPAQDRQEPKEINNVSVSVVEVGSRLNPFSRRDVITVTVTHPDIAEARAANAKAARDAVTVAAEKAERAAEAASAEAKAAKDRDRAARIFEGGHDRGLGTADYLKIEADHRAETANFARNAEAAGQVKSGAQASDAGTARHVEQPRAPELAAEPAQLDVVDQAEAVAQTAETGIEHVVMKPGQELEGEIVAEVRVKDVVHHSIEFSDDNGQTKRTLVNTGGNSWSVGDAVQVARTSKGFEIEPSRGYGM